MVRQVRVRQRTAERRQEMAGREETGGSSDICTMRLERKRREETVDLLFTLFPFVGLTIFPLFVTFNPPAHHLLFPLLITLYSLDCHLVTFYPTVCFILFFLFVTFHSPCWLFVPFYYSCLSPLIPPVCLPLFPLFLTFCSPCFSPFIPPIYHLSPPCLSPFIPIVITFCSPWLSPFIPPIYHLFPPVSHLSFPPVITFF